MVTVNIQPLYIEFTLKEFRILPLGYHYVDQWIETPPAVEFRLLQLPVKEKALFGSWLNICRDETSAVGLLGTSPHTRIDSELRGSTRLLTADAIKEIRMEGLRSRFDRRPCG